MSVISLPSIVPGIFCGITFILFIVGLGEAYLIAINATNFQYAAIGAAILLCVVEMIISFLFILYIENCMLIYFNILYIISVYLFMCLRVCVYAYIIYMCSFWSKCNDYGNVFIYYIKNYNNDDIIVCI